MTGGEKAVTANLKVVSPGGNQATLDFHVLLYREDADWCALALEVDLRGYGATMEAACEDLTSALERQFLFSLSRRDPGTFIFPAEGKYFEMFFEATSRQVKEYLSSISGEVVDSKIEVDLTPQLAHAAG